ncbi:hypothetical protein COCMIDRAFT_103145, partial [Bipolaris oryzae ATCC 44560]
EVALEYKLRVSLLSFINIALNYSLIYFSLDSIASILVVNYYRYLIYLDNILLVL